MNRFATLVAAAVLVTAAGMASPAHAPLLGGVLGAAMGAGAVSVTRSQA